MKLITYMLLVAIAPLGAFATDLLKQDEAVLEFSQDLNMSKKTMEKTEYSQYLLRRCEEALSSARASEEVKMAAKLRLASALMPPRKGNRSPISEEIWDATRSISLIKDLLQDERVISRITHNHRRTLQLTLVQGLIATSQPSEASEELKTLEKESKEIGDYRTWARFWAEAVKAQGGDSKEISAGLAKMAKAASAKEKSEGIAQQISLMGFQEGDAGIVKQGLAILKAHDPDSKWTKNIQYRLEKLEANPEAFKRASSQSSCGSAKAVKKKPADKNNSCGCGSTEKTNAKVSTSSGCGGCSSAKPEATKQPVSGCGGCGSTEKAE